MTDVFSILIQAVFSTDYKIDMFPPASVTLSGLDRYFNGELVPDREVKRILREKHPYLTEEKLSQVLALYHDIGIKAPEKDGPDNVFYSLVRFVKDKAVLHGDLLRVRFEELLRWRELAYFIGEDILVCTWLAYRFRWTSQDEWDVHWNMSTGVDDPDLQYLYARGLTDLHHHLKASTDVFTLSWVCLMNHITHRYDTFRKMGGEVPRLYKLCFQAALIRVVLHKYLKEHVLDMDKADFCDDLDCDFEYRVSALQQKINVLLSESKSAGKRVVYDYAYEGENIDKLESVHVFDGERNLQYGILRDLFRGCKEQIQLTRLFFQYLQIKIRLREYMVQVSSNVGFANFSNYERRKDMFLKGYSKYESLLCLLPILEGKQYHHLKYLETRIAPKSSLDKMRKSINQMVSCWNRSLEEEKYPVNLIVHFIKNNDSKWKTCHERHHALRKELKKQCISLMTLRRRSNIVYEKVVGIDAANTELDCRPEVFAHAFRYVKKHSDDFPQYDLVGNIRRKSLHYTYHAGEDFYDIVDGLRAIDEAVYFLNLSNGDGLGHCIALGIDPYAYYCGYDYNIVAKKQYLIDNIVWILHKVRLYSIAIPSSLEMYLLNHYRIMVFEIYGKNVDFETYYMSMLLRADDPFYSSENSLELMSEVSDDWRSCSLNADEALKSIRSIKEVRELYHDYHFNKDVRERGDKIECMKVKRSYVECVRQLQDCMMFELGKLGIVIECCPSSNLKIGFSNRYEDQPIFRFAPIMSEKRKMAVTINTDDLGIFQTSVDNEYSLLAIAAVKAKNSNGQRKYNKCDVVRWLEDISENGMKYAFDNTK